MRLAASSPSTTAPKKRYNSFLFISKTPFFSLAACRHKGALTRRKKRQGGREESNPPPATTASVGARSSPAGVSILLAILGFTKFQPGCSTQASFSTFEAVPNDTGRLPHARSRVPPASAAGDVLPPPSQGLLAFFFEGEVRLQVFVGGGLFCRQ